MTVSRRSRLQELSSIFSGLEHVQDYTRKVRTINAVTQELFFSNAQTQKQLLQVCWPLKSCGRRWLLFLLLLGPSSPEKAEKAASPLVPHPPSLSLSCNSLHSLSHSPPQKFILPPLPSPSLLLSPSPSHSNLHNCLTDISTNSETKPKTVRLCSSSSVVEELTYTCCSARGPGGTAISWPGRTAWEPHSPPTPHPRAGNFLLLGSGRWLGWVLKWVLEIGCFFQSNPISQPMNFVARWFPSSRRFQRDFIVQNQTLRWGAMGKIRVIISSWFLKRIYVEFSSDHFSLKNFRWCAAHRCHLHDQQNQHHKCHQCLIWITGGWYACYVMRSLLSLGRCSGQWEKTLFPSRVSCLSLFITTPCTIHLWSIVLHSVNTWCALNWQGQFGQWD